MTDLAEKAKTLEAVYTLVKIGAVFVAAGWTYYQWDRVFFPEAVATQSERASLARPDADIIWDALTVYLHGRTTDWSAERAEVSEASSNGQLVEIVGILLLENPKPYPITLDFEPLIVTVEYSLAAFANSFQVVSFDREERLDMGPDAAFVSLSRNTVEIESQGSLKLPTRVALLVDERIHASVHQYKLSGSLTVAPVAGHGGADPTQSKVKHFSASALINGTSATAPRRPAPASPQRMISVGGSGVFR